MLIISYLNGINHKTVSKQLSFIFIFFISLCTPHIVLIVSECNKYCKSHKSSTAQMAEWLERDMLESNGCGVGGSNPTVDKKFL